MNQKLKNLIGIRYRRIRAGVIAELLGEDIKDKPFVAGHDILHPDNCGDVCHFKHEPIGKPTIAQQQARLEAEKEVLDQFYRSRSMLAGVADIILGER